MWWGLSGASATTESKVLAGRLIDWRDYGLAGQLCHGPNLSSLKGKIVFRFENILELKKIQKQNIIKGNQFF